MKVIDRYAPPTPADLAHLKSDLGLTSNQMAELAGLSQGSHWRKYTGRTDQRTMQMHMHFYLAAMLTLSEEEIDRIAATMREQGAEVELAPLTQGRRDS